MNLIAKRLIEDVDVHLAKLNPETVRSAHKKLKERRMKALRGDKSEGANLGDEAQAATDRLNRFNRRMVSSGYFDRLYG